MLIDTSIYIKWEENETMKTYVRTLINTDMNSFAELDNSFQMLEEYFFICVI